MPSKEEPGRGLIGEPVKNARLEPVVLHNTPKSNRGSSKKTLKPRLDNQAFHGSEGRRVWKPIPKNRNQSFDLDALLHFLSSSWWGEGEGIRVFGFLMADEFYFQRLNWGLRSLSFPDFPGFLGVIQPPLRKNTRPQLTGGMRK